MYKLSKDLNKDFFEACSDGNLTKIKKILTFSEEAQFTDIDIQYDQGLRIACSRGYLDLVQYLLTSPELEKNANIHAKFDAAFRNACYNGHLEVVKYLLTSQDLKDKADIHTLDDSGFTELCRSGQLELINYFLYDMKLEITNKIDIAIKKNLSEKNYLEIKRIINKRDLYFSLETKLEKKAKQKDIKL